MVTRGCDGKGESVHPAIDHCGEKAQEKQQHRDLYYRHHLGIFYGKMMKKQKQTEQSKSELGRGTRSVADPIYKRDL